jgi:hypothetical protein
MRRRLCGCPLALSCRMVPGLPRQRRLPRKYQTYSSTSLRCTDLFPPHRGIVKVGEGDAMVASFRSAQGGERARSCDTHKG